MEEQQTTTIWTPFKKKLVYGIIAVVLILSITAVFIPSSREFVTNLIQVLLSSIKPIVTI